MRQKEADRPVIIGAAFKLSLSANGRPVTFPALMAQALITTTVWTIKVVRNELEIPTVTIWWATKRRRYEKKEEEITV